MTAVLGISGFYHDAAAALVVDGEIVAAAQEERFTRIKHDPSFPSHAIDWCLAEAGLEPGDLAAVAFYEKPWLKFERILETHLAVAPAHLRGFLAAMPAWLGKKLFLPAVIRRGLGGRWRGRCAFPEHHESHAASGFFPSPFDRAAILTLDGVGEWATATFGTGAGNRIELTHELRFPHSPGLLYSAFTSFCGFRVDSGEYKLMGLAPYGEPRYAARILDHLVDLKPDGSFRLDTSYFGYCGGLTMTTRKFHRLFDGPPRRAEAPLTQREMDLAASVQQVIEEIVLRMARYVHAQTAADRLCLAGGVALNCVANGRLTREGPFAEIWIQPAAGDAGGALGAALFVWHQLMDRPRVAAPGDRQQGSRLGPAPQADAVRRSLDAQGAVYRELADDATLVAEVASLLAAGRVVGWVQGRMEFGPRALGGRSILGDPRDPAMQSTMNLKIKFRESFRPFAPAVPVERAAEWFALAPAMESPYMLLVAPLRADRRIATADDDATRGLDRLRLPRSTIPAVTHVDGSARVQTVDRARDARFHALLEAFGERTGTPVLVNTSFNVRGEPLVCSADDAYRCFMATDIDVLAIDRFLLVKAAQPARPEFSAERHRARFAAD